MIVGILSLITAVALVYCCDIPVMNGFEIFINDKQSIYYGVGLSIIASYIFYIIQVAIPQWASERQALKMLEKRIDQYLELMYQVQVFCKSACKVEKEKNRISIISPYVLWNKNDEEAKIIMKMDISSISKMMEKRETKILQSGYFMQLEGKRRMALQRLIDNNFLINFKRDIYHDGKITDLELIQEYEDFVGAVDVARKLFQKKYVLNMVIYTDEERIEELEWKMAQTDFLDKDMDGIFHMGIKD